MIGEIIKIDPIKISRNEGETFIRVYFKLENKKFAKTDLVPDFRNYLRWRKILKVGNQLGNLILKESNCVNADSFPILIQGEKIKKKIINLEKLFQLGVFG